MKTSDITLRTIGDLVDHKLLLLPAFQRRYLWNDEKIRLLFDSFAKGIPVGAVTLATPSFAIGAAEIDRNIGDERGTTPNFQFWTVEAFVSCANAAQDKLGGEYECRLILDGQQRITSIYRALHGKPNVYFALDEKTQEIGTLASLSKAIEAVLLTDTDDCMCIAVDVAYRANNVSDADLLRDFEQTRYGKNVMHDPAQFKEAGARYCRLARHIEASFLRHAAIPCITAQAREDSLITYFERSNTQGEPLEFYDLLNAKTFHAFKSTEWKSLSSARKKLLASLPVERRIPKYDEYFIRSKCFDKISARCGAASPIAKGTILEHIDGTELASAFEERWNDFQVPLAWLFSERLAVRYDHLPFPLMLLPLYFFFESISFKSDHIPNDKRKVLHWWYWSSVFSERYSYRTNEAATEDIALLRSLAKVKQKKKLIEASYVARLSNRLQKPEQVRALSAKGGHFQRAILQLGVFQHNSADPFTGSGLATLELTRKKGGRRPRFDYHHIIPTAHCASKGLPESVANTMCNVMYATTKLHRGDGDAPSQYLKRWEKQKGVDLKRLTGHFITNDMLTALRAGEYDSAPEKFFDERAKVMCRAIGDAVSIDGIQEFLR